MQNHVHVQFVLPSLDPGIHCRYIQGDTRLRNVLIESGTATSMNAQAGQGGGLFVVAGKLLMTGGTSLVGNSASGSGAQYIAIGGVATYLLPAPPGTWIAGELCIVYRETCPRDEKGNVEDPNCEATTQACQYQSASEAIVSGTQCQPLLANQPCDWYATRPDASVNWIARAPLMCLTTPLSD